MSKEKQEEMTKMEKAKEMAGKAAEFAKDKAGEAKEKWDGAKPETRKNMIKVVIGIIVGLLVICKLKKKK